MSWDVTIPKKMDTSNTCYGDGVDSSGINLEILIRHTHSGNSLIKNNLHWFVGATQNSTPTLYIGLQFRIYSQLFEEDGYIVLV